MELQETIERLRYKLDNDGESWYYQEEIETVLKALKNSIPKKKIEDKIEELKKEGFEYENKICTMYYVKQDEIDILQDLLEEN